MAATPRVEIDQESRIVIGEQPRRVLRRDDLVKLSARTKIEFALPAGWPTGSPVRIDAWASVRIARGDEKGLADSRKGDRRRVEGSVVEEIRASHETKLDLEVPADLVGRDALVSAVAYLLPGKDVVSTTVGPWVAEGDARLRFGFALEPPGWTPGHPPVSFRIVATPSGGDELVLFERRIDPARDPRDRRWHDASVDLSRVRGRPTTFRLEARILNQAPGVTRRGSFPVFANPTIEASARPDRRNLILISLDTLRAKSVGAYGAEHDTTPAFDRRVAAAGALVRRAVVPAPYTPPSHMTMLTGLEPCAHGVLDRSGVLGPEDLTLAEILRHAGYRTAAFTENAYVVAASGFARGFDTYVEQRSDEEAVPGFAALTFEQAERWLATDASQPFFLFLHTYEVHAPYRPPRGYQDLFGGPPEEAADEEDPRAQERRYEQEIRYTDDLLGGFLDILDARGLSDDTILVVTSDHGEGFIEHFWRQHGFSLYDEALLVPLALRAPGLIEPGTVVEPEVGLVDLVPTLLSLLDVPQPRPVQGRSFAARLGLPNAPPFAERPVASVVSSPRSDSVRFRDFKYIRTARKDGGRREELYDLRDDPREKRNLAERRKHRLASLSRRLDGHLGACAWYRDAHPAGASGGAPMENRPQWLVNEDEVKRRLRSLGYVE